MKTDDVEVSGKTVTITTKSAATAREIAASAAAQRLKKEGGVWGFAEAVIEEIGDGLAGVSAKLGRGTFEILANSALVIGAVIAFISWSRLLPLKDDLNLLIGVIGVLIIVGTKVAAGRWAKKLNEGKRASADSWRSWVIAGIFVDAIAALAFSVAAVEDEKSGRINTDVQIESLEREARQIGYRAETLDRPSTTAEILQLELDQLLNQTARNREGTSTGKPVRDWIGWGTDTYCITTGNNTFYVDRYCEDVIAAQRALLKREAYEGELARAEAARASAEAMRAQRPERSSGAALGSWFSSGERPWMQAVVPMALMFIILVFMVTTAFLAKRDLDIEPPPKPEKV